MFSRHKQQTPKKDAAAILAVLFLDQISKFIIVENIFFEIEIYENHNALFDLPINSNLIFISFAVFAFACYFIPLKKIGFPAGDSVSRGLIFGGILGNLTDRFFYGYIIDYINLFNLFVFNIADLAICLGALLLSWKILRK